MADVTINGLTELTSVDRAADMFEVSDASDSNNSKRSSVNSMLDITSHPVGETEVQTLINKTLTTPNISSPVLSGTLTGTYTLGGTPTFPSSVVTLTGSQTLINKVLTSPTINAPTITNPTLTTDTVSEFTSAAGVTIDGVLLKDSKMNGSYITNSSVGSSQLAAGVPVQVVNATFTAVATGTTVMPVDDTIPQIGEGNEYMTLTITPKSATNTLVIQVIAMLANTAASPYIAGALFQDATTNGLAASTERAANASDPITFCLTHSMPAGTTSSTTFRFRAGASAAGTTTFNGQASGRLFGGITKSSITIMEYKA